MATWVLARNVLRLWGEHGLLMIGKTVSHYRILEKLGEGGMGVVYKAEDTKLGRVVALKFLSPDLTRDPEATDRFTQEAKAASSLDHINICNIHEVDETQDGQMFIAMAWYEGKTVKQKLESGPFAVDEAVSIAIQVAEGLKEAHDKNIVHRDIKSANVMVTPRGQAKIMDFGVAKLMTVAKSTGMEPTPGSGAYMSPEHVRGEVVDQRADIWSLGVVLYEMLTGQLPFTAHYEQALTYLILHEDPKPLTAFRSDIPEGLLKIVAKALQKDPDNRYQSATEFLEDLGVSCDIGTDLSERKTSIVVLPFEDISPGRDNEYFSDGLTEEIISNLSKIYSLRVISRTSAMRLKGTNKDTKTIGRELKARYLLEGSVRKAGKSLRITAQLIDAVNDVTLWAEKYSGTLEDVFDMQDRVAHSIVDALKIQLSPEEKRRMAQRPIDNVYAYEFYLKANQEIHHNTEEALERAVKYLNSGLELMGENAVLYAGMAYVYWQYVNIGARQEDYVDKAEEYVKKTFELEPESSKGHFLLGLIYQTFRADQQQSVHHFKRALASDASNSDVLLWLAVGYAVVGKTFAAYPLAERLFKIDPLVPYSQSLPGIIHFYDGQFGCALECISKAHSMEPTNPALLVWHATLLAYNRRFEEAYDMIDRGAQAAPGHFYIKLGLFMKYALRGEKEKVHPLLTPEFQSTAWRDVQYSEWISAFYALLNERDKALYWLENAVNRGYINYPFISKQDPFLDNLRGDERFKKLLQRIKREWEQFEV